MFAKYNRAVKVKMASRHQLITRNIAANLKAVSVFGVSRVAVNM